MAASFSFLLKSLFTVSQSFDADCFISHPISLFMAIQTFDVIRAEFLAASLNKLQMKKIKYPKEKGFSRTTP
jgi:hypothetical protein